MNNIINYIGRSGGSTIECYSVNQILPYIENGKGYIELHGHKIKCSGDSIRVFRKGIQCKSCGIIGEKFVLSFKKIKDVNEVTLHLVAKDTVSKGVKEQFVMLTRDHIIPVAKSGTDGLHNLQVMCSLCNNIKGCSNLSNVELSIIRHMDRKNINDYVNLFNLNNKNITYYLVYSANLSNAKLLQILSHKDCLVSPRELLDVLPKENLFKEQNENDHK